MDPGREQVLEWVGTGRHALGALLPDLSTPPRESDDTIRLQLYEAVTMLLERASENGPLVVIMEDIHWATSPPGTCSASWQEL